MLHCSKLRQLQEVMRICVRRSKESSRAQASFDGVDTNQRLAAHNCALPRAPIRPNGGTMRRSAQRSRHENRSAVLHKCGPGCRVGAGAYNRGPRPRLTMSEMSAPLITAQYAALVAAGEIE